MIASCYALIAVVGAAPDLRPQDAMPVVSSVEAPPGTEGLGVHWVKVAVPGVGVMLAAVARPQGAGPFPALLILHGSHGFAREYVQLAQAMARGGVIGVAACWFAGRRGAGSRFVTPIECPEAPPLPDAASPAAQRVVDALLKAVRTLPDVRADGVALFGHSRGGGAALNFALSGASTLRAVVLHSTGYPRDLASLVPGMSAPVLILHGTADGPADGGSAFTSLQSAQDFEALLRRAGKRVEARYYRGGSHNSLFTSRSQYADEVQRTIAFLTQAHQAANRPGGISPSIRMPDGVRWMTENLSIDAADSYCYGDDQQNCARYGRLYTWESAQRGCRLLGDGWRLPTEDEWRQLARRYGGPQDDTEASRRAAYQALLSGGSAGFNALLGGGRGNGRYARLDAHGFYWTAAESDSARAVFYNFGRGGLALYRQAEGQKQSAYSVRCVRGPG